MSIRYLAASLVLATATASSAAVLVVRSSGPSARNFPPGKSLDDNGKIALKANDMIVVLDARGTRTLKGPGTFTPGGPAKAAGTMSSLSAATGAGRGRARVGAVRSVGMATPKPTIWQVDVSKSADICLSRSATLTLWRPDPSKAMVMTGDGREPGDQSPARMEIGSVDAHLAERHADRGRQGLSAELGWRTRAHPHPVQDLGEPARRSRRDCVHTHPKWLHSAARSPDRNRAAKLMRANPPLPTIR
jgi:hypothetical protein